MRGVIEFLGLPGSGKTTLLNVLVKDRRLCSMVQPWGVARHSAQLMAMRKRDVRLARLRHVMWCLCERYGGCGQVETIDSLMRHASFHSVNTELATLIMATLQRSNLTSEQQAMMYAWFMRESADYLLLKQCHDSDVAVLRDEGFAHRAMSYFHHSDKIWSEDVSRYCALIPVPLMLCVVSVDPDIAIERVVKRGGAWLSDCVELDKRSEVMCKNQKILECVVASIGKRGGVIARVDNSGAIKAAAYQLAEQIFGVLA